MVVMPLRVHTDEKKVGTSLVLGSVGTHCKSTVMEMRFLLHRCG